jgi:hypothetical protein
MEKSMQRMIGTLALVAVGVGGTSAAMADNLAGFYVGAGVGYSTIRSDDPAYGYPGYYNDHQLAWKGIVGVRPVPFLGAEFEYIDFGQPSVRGYYDVDYYGNDTHPHAPALFAVGYLPIPVPFVDVFAKAGIARLTTDVNTVVYCQTPGCTTPPVTFRGDQTDDRFAYGLGVQSKWWGVAFRAEYERINSQFGDPDALTVSATWTF